MYTIGLEFSFESGHFLTGLPDTHKCSRPHGHNYVVIVELKSEELDRVGFVRDYFDLKVVKNWVNQEWDHRVLNDVVDCNTTVENLAKILYDKFKGEIPELSAITIKETPTTFARYDNNA